VDKPCPRELEIVNVEGRQLTTSEGARETEQQQRPVPQSHPGRRKRAQLGAGWPPVWTAPAQAAGVPDVTGLPLESLG
jgi:hypothetical protein